MNPAFSAWKEGVPFYGTLLGVTIIAYALLYPRGYGWAAAPLLLLTVCVLLFFRDFPRKITAAPNEVVAPADGTVVGIEELDETPHYDGPCKRISIFLSVFNAHVNRAPYDGTVTRKIYERGKFLNAMKAETTHTNESNAVYFDTGRGPMTVRQIAGAVARRIVCPVEEGAELAKGERFGMIRFGSRTELYLPREAEICVSMKSKVYAGSSIVARFP